MSGRIITARHGRPNLARDVAISARDYGDWWARYDASGLHPDERPPAGLVEIASKAKTVLSSTLPRAIETARWATGGARDVPADPIFVEAPLPPPPVPFLKLKPGAWGVISRSFWFWGYAPDGVEGHLSAWRRVAEIADRLAAHAEDGDILLCAHGYLNWMIDRRLRATGWDRVERDGGNHYWSWRVYEPKGVKREIGAAAAAE
ncbi:MAG: histidine phosphatase family protein [Pseudomonadota bacterium]